MSEYVIELGDVIDVLEGYNDNAFDAVLCDPPYGLSFMGKKWDYDVPSVELWREVFRVLKPGAPLIAFSGTRTYHRMVVNIEDAGFEIRDQFAWMYGSGFPKSLNVGKALDSAAGAERPVVGTGKYDARRPRPVAETNTPGAEYGFGPGHSLTAPATPLAKQWDGYGTALKPAYEPAVLARKPLEGTVAENVAKWGVGGLAIDASRIEGDTSEFFSKTTGKPRSGAGHAHGYGMGEGFGGDAANPPSPLGRWPANVLLDEEAGALLDAQSGDRPGGGQVKGNHSRKSMYASNHVQPFDGYNDSGGASRFFYCAKANKKERNSGGENNHPTVKPIALMEYLARLVMPPKPGAILVPFAGSGSEMIGALKAGWPAVLGIEREVEYVEIAGRRLAKVA